MIVRKTRSFVILATLIVAVVWTTQGHAQTSISAAEAKDHVGENATVCGEVVSTHYAARTRGGPTFLNIDKPYPNQIFTVVIWGSARPKSGNSEEAYRDKRI